MKEHLTAWKILVNLNGVEFEKRCVFKDLRADTTMRDRWTEMATSMTKARRVLTVYVVKNT